MDGSVTPGPRWPIKRRVGEADTEEAEVTMYSFRGYVTGVEDGVESSIPSKPIQYVLWSTTHFQNLL